MLYLIYNIQCFSSAVLAGAGVALVGFLGQKLWNSFQSSSTLPAKQSSDSSPTSSYWVPPKQSQSQQTSTVDMKTDSNTEKKIDIPLEFACVICKENQRRICLLPCKHVCLCNECAKRVKEICPMCMQKFDKQENVFLWKDEQSWRLVQQKYVLVGRVN